MFSLLSNPKNILTRHFLNEMQKQRRRHRRCRRRRRRPLVGISNSQ